MVILILERVPTALRGELSRWLMELRTGVFVGHVSALVRDALFDRCREKMREGGVIMIVPAQTEQGFRIYSTGSPTRQIDDFEGLYLVRKPSTKKPPSEDDPPF